MAPLIDGSQRNVTHNTVMGVMRCPNDRVGPRAAAATFSGLCNCYVTRHNTPHNTPLYKGVLCGAGCRVLRGCYAGCERSTTAGCKRRIRGGTRGGTRS